MPSTGARRGSEPSRFRLMVSSPSGPFFPQALSVAALGRHRSCCVTLPFLLEPLTLFGLQEGEANSGSLEGMC